PQFVLSVLCIWRRLQPLVQNFIEKNFVKAKEHIIGIHVICHVTEIHSGTLALTPVTTVNVVMDVLGFIDLARHGQNGLFQRQSGTL
ncbi:hypothetical protein C8R45DRAFT_1031761, partial [Mycena sanguinolenta]